MGSDKSRWEQVSGSDHFKGLFFSGAKFALMVGFITGKQKCVTVCVCVFGGGWLQKAGWTEYL